MNLAEVDEHHTHAVGFDMLSVDVNGEVGNLRVGIVEGGLEIGNRSQALLVGLGVVHDDRVVPAARHHRKSQRGIADDQLTHIEVEGASLADKLGERVGLAGDSIFCASRLAVPAGNTRMGIPELRSR